MFNIRYIFLIFALLLSTRCSTPLEKIKAVNLSWVAPILDKELDTIFVVEGNSRLFFFNNVLLYEKEGVFIHSDESREKVFEYWMLKQGDKSGVKFKGSRRDTVGVIFDVDSFLVKNTFKNFPFYSKENDSLIYKSINKDRGELIEKYLPKNKPDDSYPDTMVFRYNKDYLDIPFSFSSEMEEGKKSRVVEISNIYNPIKNSKLKSQLQARKMSFRIEKIPVENPQEKREYFERFKRRLEKQ